MSYYVNNNLIAHIDRAVLDALLIQHGAGDPSTERYSVGQRPFAAMEARDAAQAAILAAYPRPAPRQMMSVRQAALTSGPASEARTWL